MTILFTIYKQEEQKNQTEAGDGGGPVSMSQQYNMNPKNAVQGGFPRHNYSKQTPSQNIKVKQKSHKSSTTSKI